MSPQGIYHRGNKERAVLLIQLVDLGKQLLNSVGVVGVDSPAHSQHLGADLCAGRLAQLLEEELIKCHWLVRALRSASGFQARETPAAW